MKRRYPSHLKLHSEENSLPSAETSKRRNVGLVQDEVQELLTSFAEATSWGISQRLNLDSALGGPQPHVMTGLKPRRWRLIESSNQDSSIETDLLDLPSVTMEKAQKLLSAIERLVDRLEGAEDTVRRQEAELATSVGLSSRKDRDREIADRLESILDSTSRTIGACAAAIYLLDDETTNLKMRSCIGLPSSRLSIPARPLKGSLADLEALLGNAVLLSDIEMMPEWPSPEDYGSAIVVPIGSPSMPYGTLWFWSEESRGYSATQVEVANLAAGRVMNEIEQSILGEELTESREIRQQLETASVTQASLLPDSQRLHESYDVHGWTYQNAGLGGGFHHWDLTPNNMISLLVGNSSQDGPEGALVATSIQSITRVQWRAQASIANTMRVINDIHWSMPDANWNASVGLIQVNPKTNHGSICCAGKIQSFIVSERGFRPIGSQVLEIGSEPDTEFTTKRFVLQKGEILVAYTSDILVPNLIGNTSRRKNVPYSALDQNTFLKVIMDMIDQKCSDIAGYLARTLPTFERGMGSGLDRSLVLIKNAG